MCKESREWSKSFKTNEEEICFENILTYSFDFSLQLLIRKTMKTIIH